VAVSASWAVLPEMKEYERTSTTVVNGYLLPAMQRYLADLTAGLARSGVRAPVLVVASNGGVVGARQAAERPVFVVGSGPAAGVTGAARLGAALGEPNLIAFDMAAPLQVRASASNTIRTGPLGCSGRARRRVRDDGVREEIAWPITDRSS
jgi:Hydantoinase/oxoprolinase